MRDFSLDVSSGSIPLSATGTYPATFDASQVDVLASGTADLSLTATLTQADLGSYLTTGAALVALNTALSGQGINITSTSDIFSLSYDVGIGFSTAFPATAISNAGAGTGTIEHVGSNLRMTLPVDFNLQSALPGALSGLVSADLGMTGQLIGQTPYVAVVPEPSSMILALAGMIGLGWVGYRRRQA